MIFTFSFQCSSLPGSSIKTGLPFSIMIPTCTLYSNSELISPLLKDKCSFTIQVKNIMVFHVPGWFRVFSAKSRKNISVMHMPAIQRQKACRVKRKYVMGSRKTKVHSQHYFSYVPSRSDISKLSSLQIIAGWKKSILLYKSPLHPGEPTSLLTSRRTYLTPLLTSRRTHVPPYIQDKK